MSDKRITGRLKCQIITNTVTLIHMSIFMNIPMWMSPGTNSHIHIYTVTDHTAMNMVTCIHLLTQKPCSTG